MSQEEMRVLDLGHIPHLAALVGMPSALHRLQEVEYGEPVFRCVGSISTGNNQAIEISTDDFDDEEETDELGVLVPLAITPSIVQLEHYSMIYRKQHMSVWLGEGREYRRPHELCPPVLHQVVYFGFETTVKPQSLNPPL
ncbi:MAG: hypothetical protein AAF823_05755 [Planctomycetota bacterium]